MILCGLTCKQESDDENDDKSEGESEDEVTEEDGTQQERYPTYSSESCNDISILRQRLQVLTLLCI